MEDLFITRKELATELKIDVKTLRTWLKKKNIVLEPGRISRDKLYEIRSKFGISDNQGNIGTKFDETN